jgi:hypothetical protein
MLYMIYELTEQMKLIETRIYAKIYIDWVENLFYLSNPNSPKIVYSIASNKNLF